MIASVLKEFGFNKEITTVLPLQQGLINHTWKISENGQAFIIQKINSHVFKEPQNIADNIDLMAAFLKANHPHYLFVSALKAVNGKSMIHKRGEGFYRAFPFVAGSHSKDVVETPEQAYEAAKQFGRFTKLLQGVDVPKLKITIPSFHDLGLRYRQFLTALERGNQKRVMECTDLIKQLKDWSFIKSEYEEIKKNPAFKLRVTHHDTKISNILFDKDDKGLCVIDLDTVMPGYFISDVGDMMRTYLSPVNEEETNFSKIQVRVDFYKAVLQGYYNEMKDELTAVEKEYFFYAGLFMIYMQAIRFLTDYFNDDVYYGTTYSHHNLLRAKNQMVLLQRLFEKESLLSNLLQEGKSIK
jgi:Ser/Thr protein kinase RdoA (MazF antagonist)